tara:strand:+ start:276 stop:899 length:624 start_codon:yes stop_codon:yes gene_type:complete
MRGIEEADLGSSDNIDDSFKLASSTELFGLTNTNLESEVKNESEEDKSRSLGLSFDGKTGRRTDGLAGKNRYSGAGAISRLRVLDIRGAEKSIRLMLRKQKEMEGNESDNPRRISGFDVDSDSESESDDVNNNSLGPTPILSRSYFSMSPSEAVLRLLASCASERNFFDVHLSSNTNNNNSQWARLALDVWRKERKKLKKAGVGESD